MPTLITHQTYIIKNCYVLESSCLLKMRFLYGIYAEIYCLFLRDKNLTSALLTDQ